jgi:hypothetical protein
MIRAVGMTRHLFASSTRYKSSEKPSYTDLGLDRMSNLSPSDSSCPERSSSEAAGVFVAAASAAVAVIRGLAVPPLRHTKSSSFSVKEDLSDVLLVVVVVASMN